MRLMRKHLALFILSGFLFVAAQTAIAADETRSTALDVTIAGQGGTSLAGTLMLPPNADGNHRKVPAMLLIQGSGPVDRNGNIPPTFITDLEKQIAEELSRLGIASLRFDKRGQYANHAAAPRDPVQLAAFVQWENLVGDAAAAWRFLAARPEVDAARVGIFGHSEGGLLALSVATDEAAERRVMPAFLILASTPGRPFPAVLRDQIARVTRLQGASPDEADELLAANDSILGQIRDSGRIPSGIPDGLKPLYPPYLGSFYRSLILLDPVEFARQYKGPVLVIAGASDVQVSAEEDGRALDKALAMRQPDDHDFLVIPNASHNLKPVKNTDEPGLSGPITPAVPEKLRSWLAKHRFVE